ncbi:oxidoreductase, NAD-binding domain protein [Leptospira inadai serovar Lyme str. 10]|uniref:Oxidoreductase, NAD-binding domain protein n=3 Tax=Leptospira inadai TaxID=29506 RepID=V6HP18_9LEPT|nr:oxidoreductase, NAD-binding domain protein [Leptospira inadai serovar Lyme str. 10]PNV74259.1 oxidoreductase [Leptospira inadai serovar Lyme]
MEKIVLRNRRKPHSLFSMRKTKTLIVGLGRIASILEKDPLRQKPCTHAGVLLSAWGKKNFEIIGVLDPNREKQELFCKQWKFPRDRVFSDLDSFAKIRILPDLTVIATPSESHYFDACSAIRFGIKNLVIEKPVCETFLQAKSLEKLARKNETRIWVNHERRYHPKYSWAKSVLESGKYGRIRTIRASVLTSAASPGRAFHDRTGPLFHDGTHAIDLIYWLLGKPDRIRSSLRKRNGVSVEDKAVALLEYDSGPIVFLEAGGSRNYFQFEMDIMTDCARMILSNDGFSLFESRPSRKYKGFNSLTEVSFPEKSSLGPNPFENLYAEIRSVLANQSDRITGDIRENLGIMELLDRIKTKADVRTVSEPE